MWKNIVEGGRPRKTLRRMRIACWITKATNTHTEYVILIAFPQQQWLHESAPVLLYTYIDCTVYFRIQVISCEGPIHFVSPIYFPGPLTGYFV